MNISVSWMYIQVPGTWYIMMNYKPTSFPHGVYSLMDETAMGHISMQINIVLNGVDYHEGM